MLVRVAQRPQLTRRRDDHVQGRDRQPRRDPRRRGRDPGADVTAVRVGLLGDQREVPLGVGVAQHQAGVRAELRLQPGERAEASVVGHHAALHPERVGVTHRPSARRRPPDVRHERRGVGLPGGALELLVAEGGFGLLVEHDAAVRAEIAQSSPVRVAVALHLQRIRGVQQPERRPDPVLARGQPEQPAHAAEPTPGTFAPEGAGTRLVLTQRGFPDAATRDDFAGGWSGVWDMLTPVNMTPARLGRLLTPEDRASRKPGGRP